VRERHVVSAPVAGRLLRIELDPGDAVSAGETVVATLVPAEPLLMDPRSRAEAEAALRAAEAEVERSRADLDAAARQREFGQAEAGRYRELHERGVVSAERVEMVEMAAGSLEAREVAARAAVDAANRQLDRARAAVDVEPVGDLGPTDRTLRLTSPVDGVVLRRYHQSEVDVPAGEPLLELADAGRLEVRADFLSSDAVEIEPGMAVHLSGWGGGADLEGVVRRVEPSAFTKVSALGVEEQRVWVVVDPAEGGPPWASLGDGYRVEARVVLWAADDVVRVPTGALFRDEDGGWAVFAVVDGRARIRRVRLDHRSDVHAEVVDGLAVGDRVVVHPSDSVTEGARVTSRDEFQ
jgi:HlyD family secretion protein